MSAGRFAGTRRPPRRWLRLTVPLATLALIAAATSASAAGSGTPTGPFGTVSSDGSSDLGTLAPTDAAPLVVLAHRGGEETFTEQTLQAFETAAHAGEAIETDVRWTSDGVPILVHDAKTHEPMLCTGGALTVADTTYATLASRCLSDPATSKDGKQYPIPRFDDSVAAIAKIPGARMFSEVKIDQTRAETREFVDIIVRNHMTDRVVVTSFLPGELVKIRAEAQRRGVTIKLMQFLSATGAPSDLDVSHLYAICILPPTETPAFMARMRKAGVLVFVYNINTPPEWQTALDGGARTVLTDDPDAFRTWLVSG